MGAHERKQQMVKIDVRYTCSDGVKLFRGNLYNPYPEGGIGYHTRINTRWEGYLSAVGGRGGGRPCRKFPNNKNGEQSINKKNSGKSMGGGK